MQLRYGMQHILSRCRNCYQWKNNVVIDCEIASKIKCMEIKDELKKNNVTNTNDSLAMDIFIEPWIDLQKRSKFVTREICC